MKTIVFERDITTESVYDLIADIERIEDNEEVILENDRRYYHRNIYFCSNGGSVPASYVLIDYINNSEQYIFTLNGYWCLSSAGFMIFMRSKCERRLIGDDVFSIIHEYDRDASCRELKKSKSIDKFLKEQMEINNQYCYEWFRSIGVSEEQIKEMKKGEDVFIDHKQLKDILENTIKIFDDEVNERENEIINNQLEMKYGEPVVVVKKKEFDTLNKKKR